MKQHYRGTIIGSLIYQVRIVGLLLLITGLVRCECKPSPHSDPHASKLPPAPNKSLDVDNPDSEECKPPSTSDTKRDNQTAITQDMLDRVKGSSLNSYDKQTLIKVLESFQHPKLGESLKKVTSIKYELALYAALDLEDEAILQALLERKDQVEGDINWMNIMRHASMENKEVGLKTLLKAGIEAN